jgi:hypothetical protein
MKILCRCFVVWLPITRTMSSPAFSIGKSGSLRTGDSSRPVASAVCDTITTFLVLNPRTNLSVERYCPFKRLPKSSV